jgi:hypothetical protein
MAISKDRTLCIRPSLADAGRWSIDTWLDATPYAAYQATLETFPSAEEAQKALPFVQADFAGKGGNLRTVREETNASRTRIPQVSMSEEELKKHLQKYIESSLEQVRKFSMASFFEPKNWVKTINALAARSPLVLSILTIVAVLFRSGFEHALAFVLPDKIDFLAPEALKAAPLIILLSTCFVQFSTGKVSIELDRVRQWLLLLVVQYKWDLEKVLGMMRTEFEQLDYASHVNRAWRFEKRNPASFTNVVAHLTQRMGGDSPERAERLVRDVLRDDFARKIQALAGVSGEADYDPAQLAVNPLKLLLSIESVNIILLGILGATPDHTSGSQGIVSSRRFHERIAVRAATAGTVVIAAIVATALALATHLAFKAAPWLFVADIAASLAVLGMILRRPFLIVGRRRYIPRGLELYEIGSALKLDIA